MSTRGRRTQRARPAGLALGLSVLMALSACEDSPTAAGRTGQPCAPCSCAPAGVVDVTLLAFLSKARAAHHQADIAEQEGRAAAAVQVLDRLVAEPIPARARSAAEVREVLADTHARLAEIKSGLGRFDEAKRDVAQGLKLARERTHFRGRLMEVRGLVEERHAKKLAADGDAEGARAANARAVAAFEKAIEIQAIVIEQALGDAGVGAGEPEADSDGGGEDPRLSP